MHTTPKVSVIMPVYNTEMYVSQAVNSISEQTLSDIEIIVVNDGSTDNSLSVLNDLAAHDNRIKVLTQENQGQAAARNQGMLIASGKYIYFMDSDDLLVPDSLECCYNKCEADDLDFVFFNAESFTEDNMKQTKYLDYYRTGNLVDKTYRGIDILNIQLENLEFRAPVWLNFTKREFLQKHHIVFNAPTSPHEDQLFSFYVYINAARVGFLSQAFFRRRLRQNSVVTSKFAWKNISKYMIIADELIAYKDDKRESIQDTTDVFLTQMMDAAIWNAHVLPLKERLNLFFLCRKRYGRYVRSKTLFILLAKKYLPGK